MVVAARGATLSEAFSSAAMAVLGLTVDPASVREREVREVRAHGSTPEDLLAQWIGECLYVHEVEGFVCRRIDFAVFDTEPKAGGEPLRLHAFLHGEDIDPARHLLRGDAPPGPLRVSIRALAHGFEVSLEMPS